MQIINDDQATYYIKIVSDASYENEEEGDSIIYALNEYCSAISDMIFYGDNNLSPEEILRLAREKNKPILL